MRRTIKQRQLDRYTAYLRENEHCEGTIEKYLRDIRAFSAWLDGRDVTKTAAREWKERLLTGHYAPVTVNSMLSSVNGFFRFLGWEDCRVRTLRIQRRLFRDRARDLSRGEYERLVETAKALGKERLALLMETICATGIRVSEVRYITVEAVRDRRADVSLKRKIRTILLPGRLCQKLLKYAGRKKIASGEIFLTRSGRSLTRRQIWTEMKSVCQKAGVEPSKVFPHNLRHLFATVFYRSTRDIGRLADLLGHSSIETTRIYLLTPGDEHRLELERLRLVS